MVLHPSTCIIYKMQYHIWIAMCTIFLHLPKCFNAIFRSWFRLGILFFLYYYFSLCISFRFILFPLAITELLQFICFFFFCVYGLTLTQPHSHIFSTLPHHSHCHLANTLYDSIHCSSILSLSLSLSHSISIRLLLSRNVASLNV